LRCKTCNSIFDKKHNIIEKNISKRMVCNKCARESNIELDEKNYHMYIKCPKCESSLVIKEVKPGRIFLKRDED